MHMFLVGLGVAINGYFVRWLVFNHFSCASSADRCAVLISPNQEVGFGLTGPEQVKANANSPTTCLAI